MNLQIADRLYRNKYRYLYSFELYIDLIINGLMLLKSFGLVKDCSIQEYKAMKLALEYNLEAAGTMD